MSATVREIMALLDDIAPLSGAEEWDNVGLLCGDPETRVERVVCALDFTRGVLREAMDLGAQMIITHHPILFRPRRNLCGEDPEGRLLCELVRSGLAMAAMHTNYDNAHPGVNDALAERLGLKNVRPLDNGMCAGRLDGMTLRAFASKTEMALGGPVRMYGDPDRRLERAAVLGGAGEDFVPVALQYGADVYVTGEMGYHKALSAVENGLCVLEAGHAATEKPAISQLAGALQNRANDVQYNICVLCSAEGLFL